MATWSEGGCEQKFQELLLYIAQQSETDPDFGMTVLNKIMFNSDFLAYARWGKPITEQEYQKLDNGPCVRHLLPNIEALTSSGAAAIQETCRGAYKQKRLIALRDPDLSGFSANEISLVDQVIAKLNGLGARGVSDLSHRFIGWKVAGDRETIPFETVFLSDRQLTDAEYERGGEIAESLGV